MQVHATVAHKHILGLVLLGHACFDLPLHTPAWFMHLPAPVPRTHLLMPCRGQALLTGGTGKAAVSASEPKPPTALLPLLLTTFFKITATIMCPAIARG